MSELRAEAATILLRELSEATVSHSPQASLPKLMAPSSLSSFRQQISHVAADRDARVSAAQRSLITIVNPARLRRADVRNGEERVREIWEGLAHVRKMNEKGE